MRQMADADGAFDEGKPSSRPCPKCSGENVRVRLWESSDGGYEDEKYNCPDCGHAWWVDGIDS